MKVALQVYSQFTAEARLAHAPEIDRAGEAANFIKITVPWWSAVNV